MTILHDILSARDSKTRATDTGSRVHARLRHVVLDGATSHGDADLIKRIGQNPDVAKFFCKNSKTEVPIAGTINGRFISRRIDRMLIDDKSKSIYILDYKTDLNPQIFRPSYTMQIREYIQLMRAIYPNYEITGYILWTHDFLLEKITEKPL